MGSGLDGGGRDEALQRTRDRVDEVAEGAVEGAQGGLLPPMPERQPGHVTSGSKGRESGRQARRTGARLLWRSGRPVSGRRSRKLRLADGETELSRRSDRSKGPAEAAADAGFSRTKP